MRGSKTQDLDNIRKQKDCNDPWEQGRRQGKIKGEAERYDELKDLRGMPFRLASAIPRAKRRLDRWYVL